MILDFDYITMGQRIKQRRKELNMTQADFAEKLGISQNHISAIECGSQHLSFELFVSICNTLSINPDYLINGCTHLSNTPLQVMDNLTFVMILPLSLHADLQNCWLSFIRINQTKNSLFMSFRTVFLP